MSFLHTFSRAAGALPFDLYRTLRFATRLPLPVLAREEADPIVRPDGFAPAFAVSGWVVGLLGGLAMTALLALGASPLLAAAVGVAVLVASTGALHEDGLADCADGIGGGRTRERKLEIMRDSSLGSYAVLALTLSIIARIAALAALGEISLWLPLAACLATQGLSRACAMWVASRLPHARPDGVSASLGRPAGSAAWAALTIGFIGAALFLSVAVGVPWGFVLGALLLVLVMGVAILTMRAAMSHLGGQTGDVLGAQQQLGDLAGLALLSICVPMIV